MILYQGCASFRIKEKVAEALTDVNSIVGLQNPLLVADLITAWGAAYPSEIKSIIDGIESLKSDLDSRSIEGVIIGLFEVFSRETPRTCFDNGAEDYLFGHFGDGSILEAMDKSAPTKFGRGRLANALSRYTASADGQGSVGKARKRRSLELIDTLRLNILRRHKDEFDCRAISPSSLSDKNYLVYFTREFATKFVLHGSLGSLLSVVFGSH